jgi:hypothetical protein
VWVVLYIHCLVHIVCCIYISCAVFTYRVLYLHIVCCIYIPCAVFTYRVLYLHTVCCIYIPCAVFTTKELFNLFKSPLLGYATPRLPLNGAKLMMGSVRDRCWYLIVYINNLPNIIINKSTPVLFADDTSVIVSNRNFPTPNGSTAPWGPTPPLYRRFTITLRHTTVGRTPLEE